MATLLGLDHWLELLGRNFLQVLLVDRHLHLQLVLLDAWLGRNELLVLQTLGRLRNQVARCSTLLLSNH